MHKNCYIILFKKSKLLFWSLRFSQFNPFDPKKNLLTYQTLRLGQNRYNMQPQGLICLSQRN
ncbi:hypothetical protein HanPI659440_Chr03g0094631 [Helianthus annuus]|nr:hypothetical protein HanPI659440_Chr03g0094631 [Helianthus annuus]